MPCCQARTLTAASLRPSSPAISSGRQPASASAVSRSCSSAVHFFNNGERDCMVGSCLVCVVDADEKRAKRAKFLCGVPLRPAKGHPAEWAEAGDRPHSDPNVLAARVAAIDQDRAIVPHVEDRGQAARAPLAFGAGRPRPEMLIRPRCRALLFAAHLIPHWRTEFLSAKVDIRSNGAGGACDRSEGLDAP